MEGERLGQMLVGQVKGSGDLLELDGTVPCGGIASCSPSHEVRSTFLTQSLCGVGDSTH